MAGHKVQLKPPKNTVTRPQKHTRIMGIQNSPDADIKARQNYALSITSGKMGDRLKAVSLSSWKNSTLAKADRLISGITAAKGKIVDFQEQRQSWQDTIDRGLAAMPTKTLTENIARATYQMRQMSEFTFKPGQS